MTTAENMRILDPLYFDVQRELYQFVRSLPRGRPWDWYDSEVKRMEPAIRARLGYQRFIDETAPLREAMLRVLALLYPGAPLTPELRAGVAMTDSLLSSIAARYGVTHSPVDLDEWVRPMIFIKADNLGVPL